MKITKKISKNLKNIDNNDTEEILSDTIIMKEISKGLKDYQEGKYKSLSQIKKELL